MIKELWDIKTEVEEYSELLVINNMYDLKLVNQSQTLSFANEFQYFIIYSRQEKVFK